MGLIVFAIVCQCLQRSIDAPISIAIYLRPIQRLYMKAAPKLRNRKKMTNYSLKKKMSFARVSSNLSQTRRKILMIFLFLIVVYQFFGFNGNVGTASLRGHFQGSSTLGADHDVWVSPNAQPFVSVFEMNAIKALSYFYSSTRLYWLFFEIISRFFRMKII